MFSPANLFQEHISLGHLSGSCERVLHDSHDGSVGLRREDHPRYHNHLLNLRPRLEALGDVKVHLVSVKVSVVGRGHAEVEPERGPGKDLDSMTHHGHLVKGRLTVEDDQVIINDVSFNLGEKGGRGERNGGREREKRERGR